MSAFDLTPDTPAAANRRGFLKTAAGAGVAATGITGFPFVHASEKLTLRYLGTAVNQDKKIAEKVILALLFFPTSFYFLTAYSEGLFFFLIVATFYFLRHNRGRFFRKSKDKKT